MLGPDHLSSSLGKQKESTEAQESNTGNEKENTQREGEGIGFAFPYEESLLGQTGQRVRAARAAVPHW